MDKKKKRFRWNAVMERFADRTDMVIGAELGVWRGKMSYQLLSGMPNLFLYMVDRWAPPESGDSYHTSGSEMALCDKNKFDRVYLEAMEKVKPFTGRYSVSELTTTDASKYIKEKSLDFVFIDADHSYIGVRNDIINWRGKVKHGGWLCGHDWGNLKKGNVEKAVKEFYNENYIEFDCNSTWFVRL